MSIIDFVKSAGEKLFKPNEERREVAIETHLAHYGISGIKVELDNSKVTLTGTVRDSATREKAVLIAGNVEGIDKVDDRLSIAAGAPAAAAAPSTTAAAAAPTSAPVATSAPASAGDGWTSRTYTVKSGDTLSKISKEMYGEANKYSQIFEANKPMLKDPDKIYPGQVLRIPVEH